MNVLIEDGGKPVATADALNRIGAVLQYIAGNRAEDGTEDENQVYGRQLTLDLCIDALAVVSARVSKEKRDKAPKMAAVV